MQGIFFSMKATFPKHERLTLRKDFLVLRKKGKKIPSETVYAYYYLSRSETRNDYLKAAFIISKKNIKRANKRNLLRRRMREAFRKHKFSLVKILQENNLSLKILFIYGKKELANYASLEREILKILSSLEKKIKAQISLWNL